MDDHFALLVACGRAAIARVATPPAASDDGIARHAPALADVAGVLEAAGAHGVAPLACRELLARPGLLSDKARRALVVAQRAGAVRAFDGLRELRDVLRRLEAAGVHALPYKGPVLAFDAWGDVSLRDSADLDVVVAPRDVDRAAAALEALGYRPADGRAWPDARAVNDWQAQVTLRRDGGRVLLDLHWRFCDRKLPWSPDIPAVFARGQWRHIADVRVPVPAREDQVLLVLLHAARHGWDRLEAFATAGALLARGVDADILARRAAAVGGRTAVLSGVEVVRRLFGTGSAALERAVSSDLRVVALARDAEERLRRGDAGVVRDARLHLTLLDGAGARARYLAMAALLPTSADAAALPLPRGFRWLFPLARLWRLGARQVRR